MSSIYIKYTRDSQFAVQPDLMESLGDLCSGLLPTQNRYRFNVSNIYGKTVFSKQTLASSRCQICQRIQSIFQPIISKITTLLYLASLSRKELVKKHKAYKWTLAREKPATKAFDILFYLDLPVKGPLPDPSEVISLHKKFNLERALTIAVEHNSNHFCPEIIDLFFSTLTLVEIIRASGTSQQWYRCARERVKRIFSDETVLWCRQGYFYGHYLDFSDDQIRHEIEKNPPPPSHPTYGINLLGEAIRDFRVETVKELLAVGFDPNQRDLDKLLPLCSATFGDKWNIITEEKFMQFKKILIALLEAGFDLNQDSFFHYHLLTLVKPLGRPSEAEFDLFAFSLEQGLNINLQNPKTGKTLFHSVLDQPYDVNAPYVVYLLEHGADPTIPNTNGETPISIAKDKKVTAMLNVFRQQKYINF